MPNPTLYLSRWSGAGRTDFTIELDAPNITGRPAHNGGVLYLPLSAKPDQAGFGASIIALQGRLVIAESAMNNPGMKIPMQAWSPNYTALEVPLTFSDMALAEIARGTNDTTCQLDLVALANIRHEPPAQPQQSPPWPTQAWITTVARDNGTGVSFTLLKQHWLDLLKAMGFDRTRLIELPVAPGAVGPHWAECMRLLQSATSDVRANRRDSAVGTCRKVIEGIGMVLEQQWGVKVDPGDSKPTQLKELSGRMASAWPNDKEAGELLASLYAAAWSWSSPEHHYGSTVPEQAEAELAVLLTASLVTHAGHLLRAHPEPLKKPVPTNGQKSAP